MGGWHRTLSFPQRRLSCRRAGPGDAALKAGSGHAAFSFLLTIGSFLHPPKQTLQCFLKCSQQLETKATSVSY